jgi:acyl carrier protein
MKQSNQPVSSGKWSFRTVVKSLAKASGLSLRRPYRNVLSVSNQDSRKQAEVWATEYYSPQDADLVIRFILVLANVITVSVKQLKPETNFVKDLGMDDMEPTEMFIWLEEEFQINQVPDRDAEKLVTIDLTIQYLKEFIPKNLKKQLELNPIPVVHKLLEVVEVVARGA